MTYTASSFLDCFLQLKEETSIYWLIIDEYSCFPFVFVCKDMLTTIVLSKLFCIFDIHSYMLSDRGPSFMLEELRRFFQEKGVATSESIMYSLQGNSQVERLNGTVEDNLLSLKIERFTCASMGNCTIWYSSLNRFLTVYSHELYHPWIDIFLSKQIYPPQSVFSWLTLLEKCLWETVQNNKYLPTIWEAELVNPDYAFTKWKKSIVSWHLAHAGEGTIISEPEWVTIVLALYCTTTSI